jgi:hypothetical protein
MKFCCDKFKELSELPFISIGTKGEIYEYNMNEDSIDSSALRTDLHFKYCPYCHVNLIALKEYNNIK